MARAHAPGPPAHRSVLTYFKPESPITTATVPPAHAPEEWKRLAAHGVAAALDAMRRPRHRSTGQRGRTDRPDDDAANRPIVRRW